MTIRQPVTARPPHPTEPQDGRQQRRGKGALPSVLASTDARSAAWVIGLTLAALVSLFLGNDLHTWAGMRP